MSTVHVIVGAGSVGTAAALLLADVGHEVRLLSRSGTGPDHPGVQRIRVDAGDTAALTGLAAGATALYNCANPPYHRWPQEWPPLAASILSAAEVTGAVLATVSNLYPYGPVRGPMSPRTPEAPSDSKARTRAAMWADALASHQAGRVRAVEVRASDYLDAGAQSAVARQVPALLAGRRVRTVGDPDQAHSWTTTRDTAAALVAAAGDVEATGRVWHVPTNPPRTQREALADVARAAGVPLPRVSGVGESTLRLMGLFDPVVRELRGTLYQFTAPFVIDDSETRTRFGLVPEPWVAAVSRVAAEGRPAAAAGRAA